MRVVCIKGDYGRLDITEVHRIEHRLTKLKHPWTNGQVTTDEPDDQRSSPQTLPLRQPYAVADTPTRLHGGL